MNSDRRVLHSRYRLVTKLGAGGMGSVWSADDSLLKRTVALKELVQRLDDNTELELRRARAIREAQAMARVKHPAIVRIHDLFFADKDPWIVMEYIRGRALDAIIKDGPPDELTIASIGLPVLRGLAAVHRAGVVHRDVKPANILVADDDSVFLVDFGIARIAGDMQLTGKSQVLGTPEFLAPERILDKNVGPAADLWSLGVTLFFALEGYSPFLRRGERGSDATMMAILHEDPPRLRRPGNLGEIVVQMLNRDPGKRADAADVSDVLQAILRKPTPLPPAAQPRPTPRPLRTEPAPRPAPTPRPAQSEPRLPRPSSPRPDAGLPNCPTPQPAGSAGEAHPRSTSQPAFPALAGLKLEDAQEIIKNTDRQSGAVMLLAVPQEQAAHILAGCPARTTGALIEVMAATRSRTAEAILRMLSSGKAGRAVDYLNPPTAASILAAMPVSEAVRILNRTDARTAAGVIIELTSDVSMRLISAMHETQAAAMLAYVKPTTVASLLSAPNDLNRRLLTQFDPSFRAQVERHLSSRRA
jgi:eukaryotic-like serine/threonine-protein kinase